TRSSWSRGPKASCSIPCTRRRRWPDFWRACVPGRFRPTTRCSSGTPAARSRTSPSTQYRAASSLVIEWAARPRATRPLAMKLPCLGAARTVTGSKHLLEFGGHRILVDCGLFQGLKELRERNWQPLPLKATDLGAVILTHAHLDHTGYLPRL